MTAQTATKGSSPANCSSEDCHYFPGIMGQQADYKHIPGDEKVSLRNLKSYIPPFLPPPPTTYAPPSVKLDGRVTYAGTAAIRHHRRPKGDAEVAALPEISVILN
nr:hypothetical protein Iba_chr04cCG11670 [Ipomoea batatas]GMC86408.1 hypothetical protein Iba_chr04dCG10670 [Ipomoea batatas]